MVLSCYPEDKLSSVNESILDNLYNASVKQGIEIVQTKQISNYPNCTIDGLSRDLKSNPMLSGESKNMVFVSPGGGSGKFGVILSEINHLLSRGLNPNFIKFETFPIFTRPANHPLNMAFEAATADLGNSVKDTIYGTNYDKDLDNHMLLKMIYNKNGVDFPKERKNSPIQFGVNNITAGIVDEESIKDACYKEIRARIIRYENEVKNGTEFQSTLDRTKKILKKFL